MSSSDTAKRAAAHAAARFVLDAADGADVIGVGTGSTVAHFIDALGSSARRPSRAVSTSPDTDTRLRAAGIEIATLAEVPAPLGIYVDGADEIDALGQAIKGGGGAHTREKAIARASRTWVCIVDDTKLVDTLGQQAAVPIEVEADSCAATLDALVAMGGQPHVRGDGPGGPATVIVDVTGLDLHDPPAMEQGLESLPGVLACGIFASRRADVILVGHPDGSVTTVRPPPTPPRSRRAE